MAKKTIYTEDTLAKMGLIKDEKGNYYRPKSVPQPREAFSHNHTTVTRKKCEIKGREISLDTEIVFAWAGEHISLNEWYSSKHWTNRNKQRNYWHDFFKKFLSKPYPTFGKYEVTLEYNSNLDPSNTITLIKLAEDVLQELEIIENDNLKCCQLLRIVPNLEMKKKSYKLTFKKHESTMA